MAQVYNKHHRNAPQGAQYIGRGSPWGNRFVIGRDGDRDAVCEAHDRDLAGDKAKLKALDALRGKDVWCYCYPSRCHGTTLVMLAALSYEERLAWAEAKLRETAPAKPEQGDLLAALAQRKSCK